VYRNKTQTSRSLGDVADVEVLERTARGDAGGFAHLVARHREKLTRAAERITGSRADAEDIVQEILTRAWQQAARYDPDRGLVSSWLLTMVRTAAIDLGRRRSAASRQPAVDVTASVQPSEPLASSSGLHLLRTSVALLPAPERELIDLAYFEGLSHTEVAQATNLPLGTVKSRLLAGLRHLRLAVPQSAIEQLVVDRAEMRRNSISASLNRRLLGHAADLYFVDVLAPSGIITRVYWGHVDPPKHDYLSNIWRFAPGRRDHRHPARQAVEENRAQFVARVSEDWKQEVAVSPSHLEFMRKLFLQSLITQPLVRDGRIIGALTLVRTGDSNRCFSSEEAANSRDLAGEATHLIGGAAGR
jgi:RNA polymerase sigma-70 factor (ECF subfamily)